MKTFTRSAARLCVAWVMGATGAVAQAGLLGDHTVTEVPVTGLGEVRLSLPVQLPNGDLLEPSTLINMVSAAMLRSSPFEMRRREDVDHLYEGGLGSALDSGQHRLTFFYRNWATLKTKRGGHIGQQLNVPFDYEVREEANQTELIFHPPATAELDTETVILNSTPSLNLDKVLKDLADVMAKAPTLSFPAAYRQKGEVNVAFKPEAVMASLTRVMGRMPSLVPEPSREPGVLVGTFGFTADGKRLPVKILAYAYRDGTKLVYDTTLSATLLNGQPMQGTDLPERLRKTIEQAASD